MTEKQIKIEKLFDLLDEWRTFPSYQLERRADIFFAMYLPDIINHKFGFDVTGILPEFPVRVGSVSTVDINKSYKIDYIIICENEKKVFLTELKTDVFSRRETQDKYLKSAKRINITGLTDGLLKIYKATHQRKKYQKYLDKLVEYGWLQPLGDAYRIICSNYEIDIIYIQPCKENSSEEKIITFDDVIESIAEYNDPISKRFTKSLKMWKKNPN